MKVYTRGGDQGETSLFGGTRVSKDDARVEAYGAVDELNSVLGVARTALEDAADLDEKLAVLQSALFDVGGELSAPDPDQNVPRVSDPEVTELEQWIDKLDEELAPLRNFILPGGAPAAAALHHARTVCRRAERRVISLAAHESVSDVVVRYLNRLSDLLFVLARVVNARAGVEESQWVGRDR
jgi:cob(I)alamin adenosyltransferase